MPSCETPCRGHVAGLVLGYMTKVCEMMSSLSFIGARWHWWRGVAQSPPARHSSGFYTLLLLLLLLHPLVLLPSSGTWRGRDATDAV